METFFILVSLVSYFSQRKAIILVQRIPFDQIDNSNKQSMKFLLCHITNTTTM